MNRRTIIAGLGSIAAWPALAWAQQSSPIPVIGVLNAGGADATTTMIAGFRQGLGEAGFTEGQNVAIEYHWAEGRYDHLPAMADDLVNRGVRVIFVSGDNAARAAKVATSSIPIVFTVGDDPVKQGLVGSLSRPAGNVTGVNLMVNEMEGKRLGLLDELVPKGRPAAAILNPTYVASVTMAADLQMAASALGRQLYLFYASNEREIDSAFSASLQQGAKGIMFGSNPFFHTRREQIVGLTARSAMPVVFDDRTFVKEGGLISYGVNVPEAYRQAGNYVGRILKGERPGDLPIIRQTKFELITENCKSRKPHHPCQDSRPRR
jgi:putative ABC transport system substrate-binding protein